VNGSEPTSDILRVSAGLLRLSAAIFEQVIKANGDERMAELVRQQREAADVMLKRAAEIQPHPMLAKWGRGQAEAMKYLHDITPGRMS